MQNYLPLDGKEEHNDWLDDYDQPKLSPSLSIPANLLQVEKQNLKPSKIIDLDKTQKIKKPKKQERRPSLRKELPPRSEVRSLEDNLVSQSVSRLKTYNSTQKEQAIPIYKKLTRERLIQFLQIIEVEYSQTVKRYLAANLNKQSCGNLKSLFLRFIDQIIDAFPVLNNIVFQYAFRYYASGPLQYRFSKLMDKNITPILKLMSEKYNKVQFKSEICKEHDIEISTHISHSPEREHLEEFQGQDLKKIEKKRRKRNKKKENANEGSDQQQFKKEIDKSVPKEQPDRSVVELSNFLLNLSIDEEARTQCRIQEKYLLRWGKRCG